MTRMVDGGKIQLNQGGNATAGPKLPPEAVGFGAMPQRFGQLRELFGGQPPRGTR
jgi:hypothetical protein